MRSCPQPEHGSVRAKVSLGTLVEIALPAGVATDARFAAAFHAVAHVQRKMSAHDSDSDVARIARLAHRRAIRVDPQTYAVLELALELSRRSRGAFDVTVAPVLARHGTLPRRAAGRGTRSGRMAAIHLLRGSRVRTDLPVALDLGGIAKGFAVDRAVAALRAAGAREGIVNAGGDLRAFGRDAWTPIRVRHPVERSHGLHVFDLRDAACATSASQGKASPLALVDPHTRRARPFSETISVVAATCALADALTKVVAVAPMRAAALLAHFGAQAFRLDIAGRELRCRTAGMAPPAHWRLASPATTA